jgi:hypothetical protein
LAGPLTTISLKQLEDSNVASHYIKTTGYALTELAVGINENHSKSFYFPLVENFDDQKAINVVGRFCCSSHSTNLINFWEFFQSANSFFFT